MKKFLAIYAALMLTACASSGAGNTAGVSSAGGGSYLTLPRPNGLVILGVSARQSSRDAEISIAREDAARKASMFNGFWASVNSIQDIGSGYFDYLVASETQVVCDEYLEPYMDRLSFNPERDVSRNDDGAVFIQFTYPAAFPGTVDYGFRRNLDGSPEWVLRPPHEIGGLKTGVGHSGRQERLGDTIRKSYEAAAAAIVSYYYTSVETSDSSIGGQNSSYIYRESMGRLANFVILDIWIDPKSRAVYTLAVARPAN